VGYACPAWITDTQLPVGELPLFDQELVSKGIPAESLTDAQRIVAELESRASECRTIFPPAGCPGSLSNAPVEEVPVTETPAAQTSPSPAIVEETP
jgi:hypothetical protein